MVRAVITPAKATEACAKTKHRIHVEPITSTVSSLKFCRFYPRQFFQWGPQGKLEWSDPNALREQKCRPRRSSMVVLFFNGFLRHPVGIGNFRQSVFLAAAEIDHASDEAPEEAARIGQQGERKRGGGFNADFFYA